MIHHTRHVSHRSRHLREHLSSRPVITLPTVHTLVEEPHAVKNTLIALVIPQPARIDRRAPPYYAPIR